MTNEQEQLTQDEKIKFIKAILQNDEVSTDTELINHFMKELNITKEEASFYLSQRNDALNNIDFDLELKQIQEKGINNNREVRNKDKKVCWLCGSKNLMTSKEEGIYFCMNCKTKNDFNNETKQTAEELLRSLE